MLTRRSFTRLLAALPFVGAAGRVKAEEPVPRPPVRFLGTVTPTAGEHFIKVTNLADGDTYLVPIRMELGEPIRTPTGISVPVKMHYGRELKELDQGIDKLTAAIRNLASD